MIGTILKGVAALVGLFFIQVLGSFLIRKKRSPRRPIITCFLDSLGEIFDILKIGPYSKPNNIHTALQKAFKESKLTDLGTKDTTGFLDRYDAVRKFGFDACKAKFSPSGKIFNVEMLSRRFQDRLKLVDYLKRHPSINKIKVNSPIFVIGFPRTGTTFLHEMLGLHENVRMHYTWEQFTPVPTTHDESRAALKADRAKRYKENKPMFDFLFNHFISRDIQSIHRIGYDEPEECTIPCAFELPWGLTELPFNMFAGEKINEMGAGQAFFLYRKFLQLMTYQAEDRFDADFTWMLKCPFHLAYLDDLHKEFPDATVVWTHRDPAQFITSMCSLCDAIMRMAMEEYTIDKLALGAACVRWSKSCLDMAEKSFAKLGSKLKVVHIRYADNVSDSIGVCKSVFAKAGIECSAKYEARVSEYLAKSAEERRQVKERNKSEAVHEYHPEDYGLTTEGIRETFKEYIDKYNLLEVSAKEANGKKKKVVVEELKLVVK